MAHKDFDVPVPNVFILMLSDYFLALIIADMLIWSEFLAVLTIKEDLCGDFVLSAYVPYAPIGTSSLSISSIFIGGA